MLCFGFGGVVALWCFWFLFCKCFGIPNSPRSLDLDDRQGVIASSAMQQKKNNLPQLSSCCSQVGGQLVTSSSAALLLPQWRASEQSVHWKFVSVLAATNLNLFADLEVDFRVPPSEEAEGFAHCIREFCRQDMIFNDGRINHVWPHFLLLAFPEFAGYCLVSMLTILVVQCWQLRRNTRVRRGAVPELHFFLVALGTYLKPFVDETKWV